MTADVTYLLPVRAAAPLDSEFIGYLRGVASRCSVVVVDGSDAAVFEANRRAFGEWARHVAPDPALHCANGKVRGVLSGLAHVRTRRLIIADDDVRYGQGELDAVVAPLDHAHVVVPQNYFAPRPWHARWDTARSLLNRATGGDFPGTLAVDADLLREIGGYDGDVLFENLELIRTIVGAGGTCVRRPDLGVRRLPPTTRHFVGQRVRQAYDEFARPWRLAVALSVVPAVVVTAVAARRPVRLLSAAAVACAAMAETGRRVDGGRAFFPPSSCLWAPVWVLERGVCSWCAVWWRLRGGVPYAGARLVRAANPWGSMAPASARVGLPEPSAGYRRPCSTPRSLPPHARATAS